jgi:prepilin-type N-terminal cleavage/methylation domain-containing protein
MRIATRTPRSTRRAAGLSLLEVLIATAILSIALLALSAGLLGNLLGIRREARITASNQAAVSVLEDWRSRIRLDNSEERIYDDGASGTQTVTVDGVEYPGTYAINPKRMDLLGEMVDAGGAEPHLFEVTLTVTLPEGATRDYQTLVVRNPQ